MKDMSSPHFKEEEDDSINILLKLALKNTID